MSFIEEISKSLGGYCPKEPPFKATFFGDSAVYFENIRGIISYTAEEINLALKKGGIRLNGQGLYVKKYCMGDVAVCGKITKMERY